MNDSENTSCVRPSREQAAATSGMMESSPAVTGTGACCVLLDRVSQSPLPDVAEGQHQHRCQSERWARYWIADYWSARTGAGLLNKSRWRLWCNIGKHEDPQSRLDGESITILGGRPIELRLQSEKARR
jgi:hypothetical protein